DSHFELLVLAILLSGRAVLCVGPRLLPFQCHLSGLWRNELGSLMEIREVNDAGEFSGEYLTAVTATSNCIRRSPLKGAQHEMKHRGQPTFGFTVNWAKFSNSTTVFVGQCFVDDKRKETLKTMWLLRQEVGSPEDGWSATWWVAGSGCCFLRACTMARHSLSMA
uniref:AVID protein n=1 Tax=Chelydra serpentina TaxID=8475 RepID=A0A8C3S7T9_CHESE